ncbi:MAG: hypothetical protein V4561_09215 [Bacteroidota bacterium]
MNRKKIITSSLLFITTFDGFAQQKTLVNDTTIKATTIEITQIYQPQIKQAVKETYAPTLPKAENKTPSFEYTVPSQTQNYSYKPLPLQPLAFGSDTTQQGYKNYLKLGVGNLRTIFADAAIGSMKAKNFASNIHLGLLSQKGEHKYQKQTAAILDGLGIYSFKKVKAAFDLTASHHNFFQYGYDEATQPSKVADRQTLSGGRFSAALYDINFDHNGFRKNAQAGISFYTGNNINNEISFSAKAGADKFLDSNWTGYVGIEAVSTQLSSATYNVSNGFASLRVGASYDNKNLLFRAYLAPTIGQNQNSFLLSDVELRFRIPKAQASIGAGLKGSLTQNTYQQLFLTNPYISQFTSVQTHSNELFGFVEKAIGHHFTFNGKLSWWQYENLATFLNTPLAQEKMMVYYVPKANAISAQIGLRYQIGNSISVGSQLLFFNYNNIAFSKRVWHMPSTRLNGDFLWNPIPELSLTAYMSYVGGNYALDTSLQEVKLKPYIDLGFGSEYIVMKKISLFLNINNLLNNKYQRWQGYQAFGINIYGGVRLKF